MVQENQSRRQDSQDVAQRDMLVIIAKEMREKLGAGPTLESYSDRHWGNVTSDPFALMRLLSLLVEIRRSGAKQASALDSILAAPRFTKLRKGVEIKEREGPV